MRTRTAVAITVGIVATQAAVTWFAMSAWSAIPVRRWPPGRWHVELGNLSEALAAFATVGAAFAALWIAGRERRARRQEREDEDSTHARLVHLSVRMRTVLLNPAAKVGVPVVRVTARNFGPLPVLDVEVSDATWSQNSAARLRWSSEPTRRPYNVLRPHRSDDSYEEMAEFNVELMRPEKDETIIPVTGYYPGGSQLPIYAAVDLSTVIIKVRFTTASGVRWEAPIRGDIREEPIRVRR